VAKIAGSRESLEPSVTFIETFLRSFLNDPVSKWWNNLESTSFGFVCESMEEKK